MSATIPRTGSPMAATPVAAPMSASRITSDTRPATWWSAHRAPPGRGHGAYPMRRIALLGLSLLAIAQPSAALAWGGRGHAVIDQAALATLPADGPVFLQNYAEFIAEEAGAPDTWRGSSEPFSKIDEDPNHTWFVERL